MSNRSLEEVERQIKALQAEAEELRLAEGIEQLRFVIEAHLRIAGQPGQQWTMIFRDPSGNPIEVKGFDAIEQDYDS